MSLMVVNPEAGAKYLYRPGAHSEFIVTVKKTPKMVQELVSVTMEDGGSNTVPRNDLFEIEDGAGKSDPSAAPTKQ
jgi:hypothetical protein